MKVSSNARSRKIFGESARYLVGGVNSPVRSFRSVGGSPIVFKSAQGARLTDVDGSRYIDFCLSWGAIILGHSDPGTCRALTGQLRRGSTFGTATTYELELAKDLKRAFPHAGKWRFTSSGTEAGMTAVRLARAATSRSLILKFNGCYHGHADSFLIKAGSGLATLGIPASKGVPPEFAAQTLSLPYNDIDAAREIFSRMGNRIACVILEPIAGNMGVIAATRAFVQALRDLTRKHKALLIFDEVISGFRVSPTGAQEYLNITPDLTLLGKIIGGGLPVGAVGGPDAVMTQLAPLGPVYQAGTLSGNPLSMTAGHYVLMELGRPAVRLAIDSAAERIAEGIHAWGSKNGIAVHAPRYGSLLGIFFQPNAPEKIEAITEAHVARYTEFFWHMIRSGIYMPPSAYEAFFVSARHGESEITAFLRALDRFKPPAK